MAVVWYLKAVNTRYEQNVDKKSKASRVLVPLSSSFAIFIGSGGLNAAEGRGQVSFILMTSSNR